jgi:hypothetical protein
MDAAPHVRWLARLKVRPARAEELALARMLFFGWIAFRSWRRLTSEWLPFAALDFRPPGLVDTLGLRFASAGVLDVLDVLWPLCLLASAAGIFTRLSMLASLVLGVYLLGLPHAVGKAHHSDAILIFMLAAFALSRAGDAWSLDAWLARRRSGVGAPSPHVEYSWPLLFGVVCVVAVYFAAGIAKLRTTGLEWAWNDGGRLRLIAHAYTHEPPTRLGLALASAGSAHKVLGLFALALEVGSPLAFVHRYARLFVVGGLFSLQLGIWLTLGVFFENFFALFLVAIPWFELVPKALVARVEGQGSTRTKRPSEGMPNSSTTNNR